MKNSELNFRGPNKAPNSSKMNPVYFEGQKNKNNEESYKSSFYSGNDKDAHKAYFNNMKSSQNNIPIKPNKFGGSNSDGFTHTAVSTPSYRKVKKFGKGAVKEEYGSKKQKMDFELTILRRSIQNREKFIDLSHTHQPGNLKNM
eukprot:CAMPEP_0205806168 /NCGR_PEP_ID=MMETSP0205-20121125/9606_1 /ASSEMBLY_ACC=CAM_ASM_000278 /TAXON_ID=36767 /ORGANISM="Euplotes focardii, Strain TN1" /LENGTH=143 /DNA_ID=CAMNT_0053078545 /DNA_START=463 /DNA_END=891 /DNA_ORIENTATION=+